MHGRGEQVNAGNSLQPVAMRQKDREISGKARGFAGNVDNLVDAVGDDFGQGFWVNPLAGRVENDGVGLVRNFVENLQNIAGEKTAVVEMIQSGVFTGCLHGLLYDLHTNDLFRHRSDDLCDGSGTAVEVEDSLIPDISQKFSGGAVKDLRASGVCLEKGKRSDAEPETEKLLVEIVSSVEQIGAIVTDDIRDGVVYGMQNAG